jgi:outer membrane lipoprotein LolB
MTKYLFGIFFFLLTGCATLQTPLHDNLNWKQRQQRTNELTHWKAQGSIAIRQDNKAENGSFSLIQEGDNYELAIYGPLGMGRTTLTGDLQQVTLKEASGQTKTAASPEILLQETLGWSLPVTNLKYWLRAMPAPVIHSTFTLDAHQRLSKLEQQGWHITYEQYMGVQELDLPSKIRFQRPETQVLIVIKKWE